MAPSEDELFLFRSGSARRAYEWLGAHPQTVQGTDGTHFAVWAPGVSRVNVVGDFNDWDIAASPLKRIKGSDIWCAFVPGVRPGALYKFALKPRWKKTWLEHADPYASAAQLRPLTASIVTDLSDYVWSDDRWMEQRSGARLDRPISIYEVHLGSWKRRSSRQSVFPRYTDLAPQLSEYVLSLGFTHVEVLPIAEHPLDMSWGYQTTSYFAPTARYGTPRDFMCFVDYLHQQGIGVIVDWVPAHFPKDEFALARFNGQPLYEHADPRRGEHPDWGTYIFDYGRPEVRSFLLSNAVSWFERYHVDGLRVDAVSSMLYLDYSRRDGEWVPNARGGRENLDAVELLQSINTAVHETVPGALMIAEESTTWPKVTGEVDDGGLGFDLKWNMGWMHDTLQYMERDPIYRSYHQRDFTFSLVYAFSERFLLPLSHDEVVHEKRSLLEKMPGDDWQKFANLRLLFAAMWGHPGKKLLFMGGEFGQSGEWDYAGELDWKALRGTRGKLHAGVRQLVSDLNVLYRTRSALSENDFSSLGFQWLDFSDAALSIASFARWSSDRKSVVLFLLNFTPVVRYGYRVGLPLAGRYRESVSTDALRYGGSGVENWGDIQAEAVPWRGQPYSATVTLPPLGASILEPRSS